MKLYDVPRHTKIRVLEDGYENQELFFDHVDGMYSVCLNDQGQVIHLVAYAEVEIVE